MVAPPNAGPALQLISAAQWRRAGNDPSGLARAARTGRLVRVHSGVYAEAADWAGRSARERYRARLDAVDLRAHGRPVFSHESAAALLGIPGFRADTASVHLTVPTRDRGHAGRTLVRHAAELDDDEIVEVDGRLCTSVVRTAADLALNRRFLSAVVALDHVLTELSDDARPLIARSLAARPTARHAARARHSLEFADALSGGPLESVSRAHAHVLGFPAPVLQHVFRDAFGFVARVDFWWPEFDTVGEADGEQKYTDPAMLGGQTTAEAIITEKRREDRVRALVRRFGRWGWVTASDPHAFGARLESLGLPRLRTR